MHDNNSINNFVKAIAQHATEQPDRLALSIPKKWQGDDIIEKEEVTYSELWERICDIAATLKASGFKTGDRIIIMAPVSIDLYALVLAMMASGITIVFVEFTMPLRKILDSMLQSGAKAIIGTRKLGIIRWFIPRLWSIEMICLNDQLPFCKSLKFILKKADSRDLDFYSYKGGESAIIAFSSGTTGRPKIANRTYDVTKAQLLNILNGVPNRKSYTSFLTNLPLFALSVLVDGRSNYLPALSLDQPGSYRSSRVAKQIFDNRISNVGCNPAFVEKLCESDSHLFDSVEALGVGGAPVFKPLARKIKKTFKKAVNRIGYGSTEAEPIAYVDINEYLEEEGLGLLVGKPFSNMSVKVINPVKVPNSQTEPPVINLTEAECKAGKIGNIIVRGPNVIDHYLDTASNIQMKLIDESGKKWHNTGDMGYIDPKGRIWLVGRSDDAVNCDGKIVYPFVVESRVNELEGVKCSAFVYSQHHDSPVLAIISDRDSEALSLTPVFEELDIKVPKLVFLDALPMDARHHSKIDRKKLQTVLKGK